MSYAVTNPATGETVRTYDTITDAELETAIAAADEAHRTWSKSTTAEERAALNAPMFPWSAPLAAQRKAAEQTMKAAEGKVREALAAAADSLPSSQPSQGLLKP